MGVRDNNEASWTQVMEVLEVGSMSLRSRPHLTFNQFMSDNTRVPILLDGDTGYGNFNNARRLVKKVRFSHRLN